MSEPEDPARISIDAAETDAILISRLRDGDITAYTMLWVKHIDAALRLARRLTPSQAEDLASEGFLTMYQQIAVNKNGPDSAFRAYLFTVMRNISSRWYREGSQTDSIPDVDAVVEDDGLSRLEDRTDAEGMLLAFRELPERWQRVLWLVEVEEVPRPEIARELGIKPNAVSVLYRRARAGLRLSWLEHQIPPALRQDPGHVAGQLPKVLLSRGPNVLPRGANEHLKTCRVCADLYSELRSSHRSMARGTLAVAGFAALGVALPASTTSLAAAGAGGGALLFGGIGIGGTLLAASVGLLLLAGTVTSGVHFWDERAPVPDTSPAHDEEGSVDRGTGSGTPHDPTVPAKQSGLGRGNSDTGIFAIDFARDGVINDFSVPPERPTSSVDPLPEPGSGQGTGLGPGLAHPLRSEGYLAPRLAGTTSPGATIAIELQRPAGFPGGTPYTEQFAVPVDPSGSWSFDARALASSVAGTYSYRVWAIADGAASPATAGQFDIFLPGVAGFESTPLFEMLPLAEMSTSGIVIELHGPANGTICLSSVYSGQTATITLNAEGRSVQRLRLLTGGTYFFNVRVCEGDYRGPAFEQFVDVEDPENPFFGPFGPDPAATAFELSEA